MQPHGCAAALSGPEAVQVGAVPEQCWGQPAQAADVSPKSRPRHHCEVLEA